MDYKNNRHNSNSNTNTNTLSHSSNSYYGPQGSSGPQNSRPRFKNINHNQNHGSHGYSRSRDNFQDSLKASHERFDYANLATELLDREDIMCSKEVIEGACNKFEDMVDSHDINLKDELLLGIIAYGYLEPSKIQSYAIPQIIKNRDILAQSQSGTGKTGAFIISALQNIDENLDAPQAIILSPTSELAQQTFIIGKTLASRMPNVRFSFTVGGSDTANNIRELGGEAGYSNSDIQTQPEKPAQIVIATPGRLTHLLNRHPHLFTNIKLLIIDECDELLSGSFQGELRTIMESLKEDIQICLFSATLSNDVVNLSKVILNNPVQILIKKERMTLDGIKQTYVEIQDQNEKLNVLTQLLQSIQVQQFIIYVNSKKNSEILKTFLENENYNVLLINSSMSKYERANIVREFKKGEIKCLISTDLLSRGIDIQQLSLVINFDLPRQNNIESYIHRIGRTGRYGKAGLAINLVNRYEKDTLNLISLTFKCPIHPMTQDDLNYI